MSAGEDYKAEALAAFADAHGWDAAARPITHRNYPDSRQRQDGWTVIARRGGEVVTATWIDEVAIGPIGWHSTPSVQRPISNQAQAKRILES
ncbi:hypothetical protein [Jatrophihabitans endophyticus]|uniref:hypothetical protein n=1 Tax=Jatrophihabitans endophyticus TaxID=1206085 RepID=UPI0019E526E0|nr:hypothetical protein [Jatrophihabitans endophyticus]MBE7189976.1 hypothetical protein [Jatrophihabitans endophyticus]